MQQKLSFTKSLIDLTVLSPLCTSLSPLGTAWEEGKLPLWVLSTLCVHSPCHHRGVFGCTGVGRRLAGEGRWVVCVHDQHPLLLGLTWAIFLRALQRPSSMLLVPQPKRRSLTWETSLLTNWGKLELPNRWFHHHSSWNESQAPVLSTVPTLLNTGHIACPGHAWLAGLQPFLPAILGLLLFQGLSGQQQVEWINTWLPA